MNKKILLIDDSRTQLQSLKMTFVKAGYEVITASDGLEGIEMVNRCMPDLIISDIVMPNINGYHLCRLIKNDKNTKHIPVILLTILSNKIDRFWGIKAGADKYINKDISADDLIKEVNDILKDVTPTRYPSNRNTINNITFDEDIYKLKINEILDQALISSTIMNEFRHLSEYFQDDNALVKEIFELLNSILEFDFGGIFFNSTDGKEPKILNFHQNNCKIHDNIFIPIMEDFFQKLFPEDNDYYFNYKISGVITDYNKEILSYDEFQSAFVIPIISGKSILGGICLYSKERNNYSELKTFNIILDELKLLMRLRWLYSETKLLTIIDPLTSLYNRRYFNEIIHREYMRSQRTQSNFSVAIIDIDNFKKVNDTYGHQIGDIVLIEISKTILGMLRTTDFAFRYGGEEIVVILTDSSVDGAIYPLERIRKRISEKVYEANNGENFSATVSIGVASTDQGVMGPEDLVNYADTALYRAKSLGKNQVKIFDQKIDKKI